MGEITRYPLSELLKVAPEQLEEYADHPEDRQSVERRLERWERAVREQWYEDCDDPENFPWHLFAHLLPHEGYAAGEFLSYALRLLSDDVAENPLREVVGNPFRPVAFSPECRSDTALSLARTTYDSRDFSAMPILADALQDVGCDSDDILDHCCRPGPHVRGC